jgi:aspartyl/asparaginyl beta-hydroxylase (cupin superfamily)
MQPLMEKEYVSKTAVRGYAWWNSVSNETKQIHESLWLKGYRLWYESQDYLEAMKCFQDSLLPYSDAWERWSKQGNPSLAVRTSTSTSSAEVERSVTTIPPECDDDMDTFQLELAKRLLFCAYCEIDAQSVDRGRQRLVQALSILTVMPTTLLHWTDAMRTTWDDTWMELVMSLEEMDDLQQFAKVVVALALQKNVLHHVPRPCGWTDAWQRPGFMCGLVFNNSGQPVIEDHPPWCHELQRNYQTVLEEYESIRKASLGWSKVGSGDRGSGMTDHRVVVGQDWSEYVLFGTGQQHCTNVTKTRSLIRRIVPDAVSLAEQGGGEVIFSRLAPRTHIKAHCGPTNLRLTAHLGLIVPTQASPDDAARCQIRVGERWHSWAPGQIILFDDSYEHEVQNDTDEERVVLLLRLWHPGLPLDIRDAALLEARRNKTDSVEKRYHPPKLLEMLPSPGKL